MKKLISFRFAAQFNTVVFGLLSVFHLAIIIGITAFGFAPLDFLWGGKMETESQLLNFEVMSLATAIVALIFTMIRAGYIGAPRLLRLTQFIMWMLFVLFLLNTLGNILAETVFEKTFAIVTALLSLFSLRMALEKNSHLDHAE